MLIPFGVFFVTVSSFQLDQLGSKGTDPSLYGCLCIFFYRALHKGNSKSRSSSAKAAEKRISNLLNHSQKFSIIVITEDRIDHFFKA